MFLQDVHIDNKLLNHKIRSISDILIVRIVTKDTYHLFDAYDLRERKYSPDDVIRLARSVGVFEEQITNPEDRPKLLNLVLRIIENIKPLGRFGKAKIKLPFIPAYIGYINTLNKTERLQVIGRANYDLQLYFDAFVANLNKYVNSNLKIHDLHYFKINGLLRRSPEMLKLGNQHMRILFDILKEFGWAEAISYWEKLYRNLWIHSIHDYVYWWKTLSLCRMYLINSYNLSFNEFESGFQLLSSYISSKPEVLFYLINSVFNNVKRDAAKMKVAAKNFSEWLRGLFELLPKCLIVCSLCDILSSKRIPSGVKKDIKKIYRYCEECREDIEETLLSPYRELPYKFANHFSRSNLEVGKRYLQFYHAGRISIPKKTYDQFSEILGKYWPRATSIDYYLKLQRMIKKELGESFLIAYENTYGINNGDNYLNLLELRERMTKSDEYTKFSDIGKSILDYFPTYFTSDTLFRLFQGNKIADQRVDFPFSNGVLILLLDHGYLDRIVVAPIFQNYKKSLHQAHFTRAFVKRESKNTSEPERWILTLKEIHNAVKLVMRYLPRTSTLKYVQLSLPNSYWTGGFDIESDTLTGIGCVPNWYTVRSRDPGIRPSSNEIAICEAKCQTCIKIIQRDKYFNIRTSSIKIRLPEYTK